MTKTSWQKGKMEENCSPDDSPEERMRGRREREEGEEEEGKERI